VKAATPRFEIEVGPLFWDGPRGLEWAAVHAGLNAAVRITVDERVVWSQPIMTVIELYDSLHYWLAAGPSEVFVFDDSIEGPIDGPAFRSNGDGTWTIGSAGTSGEARVPVEALVGGVLRFFRRIERDFPAAAGIDLAEWRERRDPEHPDYLFPELR
jgi:hypothetical protein